MSAKVPVVATRVGAIPEIIEHERSGLLVEPGNPKKLAHAIGRMLHEGRFMQEIPIQAHQTLLKHFNVHSMVTAYEKLFLAVAHKSPR
jgi:glycosyltransferase involved in cell wall biosynthesis